MDELDDALRQVREQLEAVRAGLRDTLRRGPAEEARRALEALEAESEEAEKHGDALDEKVAKLRQHAHELRAELARLKYGAD